jgi:transglutaminase-like putative cysteine protease
VTLAEDRDSLRRDLTATLALTLYSIAVAVGFARVFSGWDFLRDLTVIAVVGHGTSFLLRRVRLTGWLAIPLTTLALLWVLIAQHYGDTMSWMLPSGTTWDQLDLEVGLVRDQFQTAVAPVLYGAGWAALAGFALIVAVVMSDSFAFRAEAGGEALVPGGVLFVFIAALSSDRLQIVSTGLLLAGGVLVAIALRWLHDRQRRVELTSRRGPASMAIPGAIATAVVVAVLAGVIGPRLPGAQAEPLYDTRGRGGGVTEVISPLVDIRSRLTNRGNTELFRVDAPEPAYWRATTLPEFDGTTFGLPTRSLERVEGQFGTQNSTGREIRQQIQILSLGGKLIPAAADPFQADGFSGGQAVVLNYNRDTSTLVTLEDVSAGDLFTVVSSAPVPAADQLRAAGSSSPPDSIFVELPDDLPDVVRELAAQVTASTSSSYDAALALQNWFRSDFEYSVDVVSGHGSNAIESFLNERIGYCEQFAATFAAMARTLDIPSRVAVGFTPGLVNDEGWYSVLGKNSHAWPEVWFDGIGWVGFEPTPGRGAPGAEAYTNIPAQQDETPRTAAGGDIDPSAPVNPPTPTTIAPPSTNVPNAGPNGAPQFDDPSLTFGDGSEPPEPTDTGGSSSAPWIMLVILGFLACLTAVPLIVRTIRGRSVRSHGAVDRVQLAWTRALDAAGQAGVRGRPSMTSLEWARLTASELPVAARPMRSLADLVDQVTYSPPGAVDLDRIGATGVALGHEGEQWAEQVRRIAMDMLSTSQRVRRYFTTWK